MNAATDASEEGFALLETVIAFVILAIALAIGMQTVSQSARTFVRAGDMDRAGQVLAEVAAGRLGEIDEEGVVEGETADGAVWRLSARAVADPRTRPLFAVETTVWPRGEQGPRFTYHTFVSAGTRE